MKARGQHGTYLTAVEAKVDEPFSATVGDILAAAAERYLQSDRSKGLVRVLQLGQALLGPREANEPEIGLLRYVLLTAVAGALRKGQRQKCDWVLVLTHEFVTNRSTDILHDRNASDMDHFVARLSLGRAAGVGRGEICGSFDVPGAPLCPNPPLLRQSSPESTSSK